MNTEIIKGFSYNLSLLLSISIIYNLFFLKVEKNKSLNKVLTGIFVGLIGVFLMNGPVEISSGIFFDTRSILVSTVGMFFGFIPTVIAMGIIIIFRIIYGGPGAFTGVLVTVLSAVIGLSWNKLRLNRILGNKSLHLVEIYLMGLAIHTGMLICMFSLPKSMIFPVLKQIALPVLLIYPIGFLLLCMVMLSGFKSMQTSSLLKESEERLRTVYEQSPLGIGIGDLLTGHINDVNQKFLEIIGRTKDELSQVDWKIFTHPDDMDEELNNIRELNEAKIKGFNMVKRYICPDGSVIWINMIVTLLNMADGLPKMQLFIIEGITERLKTQEMLHDSKIKYKDLYIEHQQKELLLKSLINSIPDLIFYKDKRRVYFGCNKAFERFAGMEEDKLIGLTDIEVFNEKTALLFRKMDIEMMNLGVPRKNEEIVTYPDGKTVCLETLKTPYYDSDGDILGLIGISRDITERKKKEEKILYLHFHDELTGLFNRSFFEIEKKRLDTVNKLPLSVVFGDINGLKLINDAFGHAEGDKVLIQVANILKQCSRKGDTVARVGGDEFCILLPQTNSLESQAILDRIKESCEDYVKSKNKAAYYVSISLGHSEKLNINQSLEKVAKTAEDFMYRRKLLEHESLHSSIISSIKMTMFEKSHETQAHAERLAKLSRKLGKALSLTEEQLVELELLSTLHDIGKVSVDQNILTKVEELTEEEWSELKRHPEVGYRITNASPELKNISEYILSHHERWDGNGYPKGLAGEEIPLLSRIIAVVDSYDAMTNDRDYRKSMSREEAIQEINKNAGKQFDPFIAKVFITECAHDLM
jgi:diguanylate cyclase (GGDEF)-like protein/PAS domain S-box-containing protein